MLIQIFPLLPPFVIEEFSLSSPSVLFLAAATQNAFPPITPPIRPPPPKKQTHPPPSRKKTFRSFGVKDICSNDAAVVKMIGVTKLSICLGKVLGRGLRCVGSGAWGEDLLNYHTCFDLAVLIRSTVLALFASSSLHL